METGESGSLQMGELRLGRPSDLSGIRHGASDRGLKRPLGPLTPMTEHDNKKDKPCRKEVGVFIWHLQLKRGFIKIIANVRSFQEGAKKKKKKLFL